MLVFFIAAVNGQSAETESSSGGDLFFVMILLLSMVVPFGLMIGLAIWVKIDAEANGVENPWLWAILVFAIGWIMVVIYFLVIKPRSHSAPKPSKNTDMSKYQNVKVYPGFCPHCNFNAGKTSGKCPECGSDLS
jgi:hypothetical protein